MAKLTSDQQIKQAARIHKLWDSGKYKTRGELAEHLGLPYQRVQKILNGRLCRTASVPEGNCREFKALGKTVWVYDDGRVWSTISSKFIGFTHKSGYKMFGLQNPRTEKLENFRVSRVMLEVFERPPEEGEWARHLDDDPGNNTLDNLAWGLPQDNSDDCVRNGNSLVGTRNNKAKLTEKIVKRFVRRYNGEPYRTYANDFIEEHDLDVTCVTMVRILRAQAWTSVTGLKKKLVKS